MRHKLILKAMCVIGAAALFTACVATTNQAPVTEAAPAADDAPGQPKNVVMIIVDDLNDWIGVMGGHPDTKTPNMDKLATEGTLFMNAHATAAICGPSRASVMTGLRPSTTGIYEQ